jgi:hypothetical protein
MDEESLVSQRSYLMKTLGVRGSSDRIGRGRVFREAWIEQDRYKPSGYEIVEPGIMKEYADINRWNGQPPK